MIEDTRIKLATAASAEEMLQEPRTWNSDLQVTVIVALWQLWPVRNDTNAGETRAAAATIAAKIQRFVLEYKELYKPTVKATAAKGRWTAPPNDWLKINVDGAFNISTMEGGWGFVIRNHNGEALGSGAGRMEHLCGCYASGDGGGASGPALCKRGRHDANSSGGGCSQCAGCPVYKSLGSIYLHWECSGRR